MNKSLTIKTLITTSAIVASVFAVGATSIASAATDHTLFGDAMLVTPGYASDTAVETASEGDPAGYGGIYFAQEPGTTFADLTMLSTDYKITEGDCAGGSPRFQLNTADGNIFVYIGEYPNYTDCVFGTWVNTGDLLENAKYVDTSQLTGGTQYDTYENALATFGDVEVTGIDLVVDAGWAIEGDQVVLFDNVTINSMVHTFEPATQSMTKDDCKKDGWKTFTNPTYKNQGQCVSSMVKNSHSNR